MKRITRSVLFLALPILLILAACAQRDIPQDEDVSMTVLHVQITPSLSHWLSPIADCAEAMKATAIYSEIHPLSDLSLNDADLIIRLGAPSPSDPFTTVMGVEEFIFLTGLEIRLQTLSLSSLQKIFTGEFTAWKDVPEILDMEIEINNTITLLSPPGEDDIRLLFEETLLDKKSVAGKVRIFNTTDGLLNAIEDTPYGIAYALNSHIGGTSLNKIEIQGIDPGLTQAYVLAITGNQPEGKLRQLLLCLQDSQ